MLKGFKEFIMRGNVIDLAIAVVIGAAFGAVVKAFVNDILTPLIGAIGGNRNFSTLKFEIHKSVFLYGDVIQNLISFVLIAAAVYFFVVMPLNKMAERRAQKVQAGVPDNEPRPEDIVLLEQIRDLLKAQTSS
jgi:large conductance mechanosensitive channel